ncbi:FlaA1/EpsC-like NDP-sugar epimerase [Lysinibacillus composti]|uniref:Polysaccharide biosynthesis protein n=1 Tax=Lysinibacillus composti TaxID=720633 RepID=A0A3N9UBJ2_9BACI|nr:nucleoside-diphosphate sugar epimerase/dehydratase [Lysinibacillus composti]MBM7610261.1 FlaA1/EpsC-like NDP-sugar epimerase [Lysinibacillus composti]RQW73820.1 polysaccharide biosynthesis protein [Lysinibacillus composti]
MNYRLRYTTFFILDSVIVLCSIFFCFWILHPNLSIFSHNLIVVSAITLLISHHIAAHFFHLYDRIWSVASVRELLTIFYAITISVASASLVQLLLASDVYMRLMVITWLLHIVLIGGSRFILRIAHDRTPIKPKGDLKRVLIVGAGQAGTMLVRNIQHNEHPEYHPIAFVDDDSNKQNLTLMNVKVSGTIQDIPNIVNEKGIDEIILAIPSLGKFGIKEIYNICATTQAKVKIMPRIEDVMTGKVSVNEMQEVKIEDLLGREEVKLDMVAISKKLTGKTILVTGAGGSIGSEICRQVMKFKPKVLLLLGHGENSIYTINMELTEKFEGETVIVPIIADVQDRERIFDIVAQFRPDVIYHAAAHKHVPLMEYNPKEAVKNNIFGTKNVAEAAHEYGISNFVLISTDKAVNPPNVMGSTKRIAEMVVQNLATRSKTTFAAVRFGNVLGSRGSVVPRFRAQIAAGGPITVTHPDITRYFMTIPEASRLVLQAGTLARGGEVFVLDMGEPVKITDLAKNLIKLSGYKEEEIKIEYTGLRPGEKMFEELLNPEEIQEEHVYPKIHVGKANAMDYDSLNELLLKLQTIEIDEIKEEVVAVANGKFENQRKEALSVSVI